jgi:hypothetical protein
VFSSFRDFAAKSRKGENAKGATGGPGSAGCAAPLHPARPFATIKLRDGVTRETPNKRSQEFGSVFPELHNTQNVPFLFILARKAATMMETSLFFARSTLGKEFFNESPYAPLVVGITVLLVAGFLMYKGVMGIVTKTLDSRVTWKQKLVAKALGTKADNRITGGAAVAWGWVLVAVSALLAIMGLVEISKFF